MAQGSVADVGYSVGDAVMSRREELVTYRAWSLHRAAYPVVAKFFDRPIFVVSTIGANNYLGIIVGHVFRP